jgi:hypothetical protein
MAAAPPSPHIGMRGIPIHERLIYNCSCSGLAHSSTTHTSIIHTQGRFLTATTTLCQDLGAIRDAHQAGPADENAQSLRWDYQYVLSLWDRVPELECLRVNFSS